MYMYVCVCMYMPWFVWRTVTIVENRLNFDARQRRHNALSDILHGESKLIETVLFSWIISIGSQCSRGGEGGSSGRTPNKACCACTK